MTAQKGEGGFFRSNDAGATWTRIGEAGARPAGVAASAPVRVGSNPKERRGAAADDWYRGGDPGYYNEIFVDAHDPETIWSTQTNIDRSTDGGKTWTQVTLPGVHVDHHDIVFDPADPKHYIIGNDGGLYESWDGLKTFRHFTNLPLSQFYRVSTDNASPFYHVCGGAQDNGSICGPSRTVNRVGIRTSDWINTRRRRRFPGTRRSRGSQHRLLAIAGRSAATARPANRPEHDASTDRAKHDRWSGSATA